MNASICASKKVELIKPRPSAGVFVCYDARIDDQLADISLGFDRRRGTHEPAQIERVLERQ
jgi:hypothetical protein